MWTGMERTYKYRIYPTPAQAEVLNWNILLCQRLYNSALEERIRAFQAGASVNFISQCRAATMLRKENPEYQNVYSHALQDVLRRIDNAYRAFFRRLKAGEKPGFPRFKSFRRYHSITYDRYGFRLDNGRLNLTKVGDIRVFMHRPIEGTSLTCIIKRDAVGDWWACISSKIPDVPKVLLKSAVGVDVGLKSLYTTSDGEEVKPPKFLRRSEEKVKILQRRVSSKKKGSRNREKSVKDLAKVYRKIERQRDDFLHKQARSLVNRYDLIAFENLNIKGMQGNHHLAKSIGDAGWGKLIQYTTYKAVDAGKSVVLVDPSGTSQICAQCGAVVKKSLSVRFHVCPKCGFSADRDFNAALNIRGRIPAGCGELLKTPVEATPLSSPSGGGKRGP